MVEYDFIKALSEYSERTCGRCEWSLDWAESINDYEYNTQCKKSFGEKDNLFIYCPFCGGLITEKG
jgi:hypothetical protein